MAERMEEGDVNAGEGKRISGEGGKEKKKTSHGLNGGFDEKS